MITFYKHPILWIRKHIFRQPVFTPENLEIVELELENMTLGKICRRTCSTTYIDKNGNTCDVTCGDGSALHSAKHKKTNIS